MIGGVGVDKVFAFHLANKHEFGSMKFPLMSNKTHVRYELDVLKTKVDWEGHYHLQCPVLDTEGDDTAITTR